MQPRMAIGAVIEISVVLNGRWRLGSVLRITITAIDTAAKAKSVPEFEMFASCPTGKKAANNATAMPVMIVITCGVLNFGWIFEKACGSRRSEEHTSELQSLMRISYAVFCLKKNNK